MMILATTSSELILERGPRAFLPFLPVLPPYSTHPPGFYVRLKGTVHFRLLYIVFYDYGPKLALSFSIILKQDEKIAKSVEQNEY